MDAAHFDRIARVLAQPRSRRHTMLALLVGGIATRDMDDVAAGPGCKNVGKKCTKARQCCSGFCKGKKGAKHCKAHDTGGCRAGQIPTVCGGTSASCTTSAGQAGECNTTTGNAGYCGTGGDCFPCTKDADCRQVCGPGAACVRCEGGCTVGTVCHGLSACNFSRGL